jgi:pimeloyl-ACP methyl ester carboxylesterase
MATEKPERLTRAVRSGLRAPYDSWAHRVAIHGFVRDIPLAPSHPTWRVLEELERGLAVLADRPALLLWGMRDWCFTPACLDRLARHFPGAEVHRFDDAGHFVVEDAVEQVVPLVRAFLRRTS